MLGVRLFNCYVLRCLQCVRLSVRAYLCVRYVGVVKNNGQLNLCLC